MARTHILKITAEREFVSHLPAARAALVKYANRYSDQNELPFLAARWRFHLRHVRDYWGDITYELEIEPLTGRMVEGEFGSTAANYRVPRGALDEVPETPGYVYRGMAWEEWQFIRKHCLVKSKGHYNIDQPDLTFFGEAHTALTYAAGFAPMAFKPTRELPAVIIVVPRRLVLSHADDRAHIPDGEFAVRGGLPAQAIREVWYATPRRTSRGFLELTVQHRTGKLSEGSRSSPSQWIVVYPANEAPLRRACGPRRD